MSFTLPPGLISNAQPYNLTNNLSGVVSNVIPKEGELCVPMQFNYQSTKAWAVDLSYSLGSRASQIRSLFIDNSNSSTDAIIVFPDTGFEIVAKSGYVGLFSIPNRRYNYRFYVYLRGFINDPVSVTNIIAMNIMLPPYNTYELFKSNLITPIAVQNNNPNSGSLTQGILNYAPTLLETNLAIMLIGAKSATKYKVQLNMAITDPPNFFTPDHSIVLYTIENSGLYTVKDVGGVDVYIDYFFFHDVFNYDIPSYPFGYQFNIFWTILAGTDGGTYAHEIYTAVNWMFIGNKLKPYP